MYLVYFFACVLNLLLGYFLYTGQYSKAEEKDEEEQESTQKTPVLATNIFNRQWSLILLAAVTAVTAVAKIIFPTRSVGSAGSQPIIIGDLLPAASLALIAVVLVLRISIVGSSDPEQKNYELLSYLKQIGLAAMIIGAVHIVFHGYIFL